MEIRVLGSIEVVDDDGPAQLPALMQRRLLAALVLGAREARSADVLIDALWGESPPPSAPKLLQVYVSQLRKLLPAAAQIRTRTGGYALEFDDESLDAARFERLVGDGREALAAGNPALAISQLDRALDLWRGAAYADVAYEDFARIEAERLEELRQVAVEERLEAGLALGRHEALLAELMSLATAYPLRERLQAQAMLALYRCGRQSEALELYSAVRKRLREELGLEPSVELRGLQGRILKHDPALSVPARGDEPLMVLPTPPNALLGRERQLDELRTLLRRDDVRLLVLTGAGGSGKTRLALEVARDTAYSFANGVAFVSLAPLRDPDLVVGEICRVLAVRERSEEEPLETLTAALHPREFLLVLDNAEHLRAATPVFVELVSKAPRLTLLVTSRAVLHLSGEHVYPVEPLDVDAGAQLFIERSRDLDPDFSPNANDNEAIRKICERVDGLPLAIELAASWARVLAPDELLGRLDPRLPLLTGGLRDLPARQQTLRATLDWTFDLLDDLEMRDLMRLAVFAGGFTLEAAESACGTTVERLSSLLDHNLLRRTATAGGSRYSMLETIREYSLERLDRDGGAEGAQAAHAAFYRATAEQLAEQLDAGNSAAVGRFEMELDNFRAAFAWARQADDETATRLAIALNQFWRPSGHLLEGREWLAAMLDRTQSPSSDAAKLAAELARLHFFLGEAEAAAVRAEQALRLAEALGRPELICAALNVKYLLLSSEAPDEALALLEKALEIARAHRIDSLVLRTLQSLSHQMTTRDRQVEARRIDLEGLELSRRRADRTFEQAFLANLVWGHVLLGDWDEALRVVEESETRQLARPYVVLGPIPWLHVQRGELDEARAALEALRPLFAFDEVQVRSGLDLIRAVVLRAQGQPEAALAAAEACLAARATLGWRHGFVKLGFIEAVEAAFVLDDLDRVAELLGEWEQRPLDRTPFVEAYREQFAARLAARRGDSDAVEPALLRATERFRELSRPFYVAVALLEHGEWLAGHGRCDDAEPLLAEAREIFQWLEARPWFDRAVAAREQRSAEAVP
jgi:predicted ATPase/DNA-binding SARP family transcriptional activator